MGGAATQERKYLRANPLLAAPGGRRSRHVQAPAGDRRARRPRRAARPARRQIGNRFRFGRAAPWPAANWNSGSVFAGWPAPWPAANRKLLPFWAHPRGGVQSLRAGCNRKPCPQSKLTAREIRWGVKARADREGRSRRCGGRGWRWTAATLPVFCMIRLPMAWRAACGVLPVTPAGVRSVLRPNAAASSSSISF